MKTLRDRVALITGASRGLGLHIARALAQEKARLIIAARNASALEEAAVELRAAGAPEVLAIATDVAIPEQLERLIERAEAEIGPIDLLINNAALERTERYWESAFADLDQDLQVNVRAPMYLTRLVLPGMLARDRGHIVNIASLAGLAGYAHGESYATTKHALVGFTRALRSSLQEADSAVSASAICPGFVTEIGMFARKQTRLGVRPPRLMGASKPQAVVAGVLRAIRRDHAELIVNPSPVRPLLLLALLWPRLGEWLKRRLGANRVSAASVQAPLD